MLLICETIAGSNDVEVVRMRCCSSEFGRGDSPNNDCRCFFQIHFGFHQIKDNKIELIYSKCILAFYLCPGGRYGPAG